MKTKKFFSNTYVKGSLFVIAGFLAGWIIFHRPAPTLKTAETGLHGHSEAENSVWTCSMHPQIRMEKPGQCPICGMDLIPLETSGTLIDDQSIVMSESAMKLAEVQTVIVSRGSTSKEVLLNGRIEPDERSLQSQPAHFPGRIEQLLVNVTGEPVREGQLIARVYSPELITAQNELIEAMTLKDKYPEFVEAAREKLRNWKLTDGQISEIEKTGKAITVFEIFSNTSGIILNRRVNEGDYITKGTVLFDVVDLSSVWGVFDAYESDLPWISLNQTVEFTARAIPGKIFKGKVSFIDPVINPATRTARIRVSLNNPGLQLKPEMFINGTLQSTLKEGGEQLTIPQSSVLWTGKRSIVYVKIPDAGQPAFKMREITLGASMKDTYIVADGLSEGEEIVTYGTFSVDASAQLAGKPSMMNQGGGKVSTGHDHGGTNIAGMDKPGVVDPAETGKTSVMPVKMDVSMDFTMQLNTVYDQYIVLKNAFVQSDRNNIKQAAQMVEQALSKVDMKLLTGDTHTQWMDLLASLNYQIKQIASAGVLEGQRKAFSVFNNQFYKTIKTFGLMGKTVYYQFCPMAFDNAGAYWLSETEAIRNPYFGDSMLTCGETKEILK
jgi:Cu(I)/Ag(I) efflux system membrane fusion protein